MIDLRCRALLPIALVVLLAGCAVTPINIPGTDHTDSAAPTYHPDGGGRGGDLGLTQKPDIDHYGGAKDAQVQADAGGRDGGSSSLGEGGIGDGLGKDGLIGDGTSPEAGSSDAGPPKSDTKTGD